MVRGVIGIVAGLILLIGGLTGGMSYHGNSMVTAGFGGLMIAFGVLRIFTARG